MFRFPITDTSSVPEDDEMLEIGGAMESEVEREGVKLREDLQFYFMSPCDKYRARRQIPWKLALQVLKIVMVTTQLILFGLSNQLVVSFKEENTMAFKHLFLKGYTGIDEDDYSLTVYTQRDLHDSMFYVIDQYRQISNLSLGTVSYENEEKRKGLKICKQHYHRGVIHPSNDTFYIDPTVETECLHLEPELLATSSPRDAAAINASFFNLEFYRLIKVEISFRLKGIDLQTIRVRELPDCYAFHNKITFNNQAHSGKVKIFFESEATIQDCKDWQISGSIQKNTHYILVFDAFVILTCLTSLILCSRSIVLAIKLLRLKDGLFHLHGELLYRMFTSQQNLPNASTTPHINSSPFICLTENDITKGLPKPGHEIALESTVQLLLVPFKNRAAHVTETPKPVIQC